MTCAIVALYPPHLSSNARTEILWGGVSIEARVRARVEGKKACNITLDITFPPPRPNHCRAVERSLRGLKNLYSSIFQGIKKIIARELGIEGRVTFKPVYLLGRWRWYIERGIHYPG